MTDCVYIYDEIFYQGLVQNSRKNGLDSLSGHSHSPLPMCVSVGLSQGSLAGVWRGCGKVCGKEGSCTRVAGSSLTEWDTK